MHIKTIICYCCSKRPIAIKDHGNIIAMSFNIRCINQNDIGNRYYKVRLPYIRKILENINPDVIGFQEVRVRQFKYLIKILKKYDYEYQKRDAKKDGEANPVFYKKDKFTCIKKGTFWLSDTYKEMSNTFNGKCFRICSFIKLKEKRNNKEFYVFNTHLDHVNELARLKGIKLIKRVINEIKVADTPHLIMGDMNDFYNSAPINELFLDYIDASTFNNQKENITFHNYGTSKEKIDYIALSKNITQLDYRVITTTFNGIYPSDHYPIVVTIKL